MQARSLSAAQGWRWLLEGYKIYRAAPSRLGMLVLLYWFTLLALSAIPLIGSLLNALLVPALSVGVMNACRLAERNQVIPLSTLFSGLEQHRRVLFGMGALYLLSTLLALSLSIIADDGLLLSIMTGQTPLTDETLSNPALSVAASIVLAALIPVLMAYWYAPLLASWYGLPLIKSLFFSFVATLRNTRAFLAYGLACSLFMLLLPWVLMNIALSVLPGANGLTGVLLIIPMLMAFAPTLFASFYVSYRDVFGISENA